MDDEIEPSGLIFKSNSYHESGSLIVQEGQINQTDERDKIDAITH